MIVITYVIRYIGLISQKNNCSHQRVVRIGANKCVIRKVDCDGLDMHC